jgi:hypothetical protein
MSKEVSQVFGGIGDAVSGVLKGVGDAVDGAVKGVGTLAKQIYESDIGKAIIIATILRTRVIYRIYGIR